MSDEFEERVERLESLVFGLTTRLWASQRACQAFAAMGLEHDTKIRTRLATVGHAKMALGSLMRLLCIDSEASLKILGASIESDQLVLDAAMPDEKIEYLDLFHQEVSEAAAQVRAGTSPVN